jgi:hypothetical protein
MPSGGHRLLTVRFRPDSPNSGNHSDGSVVGRRDHGGIALTCCAILQRALLGMTALTFHLTLGEDFASSSGFSVLSCTANGR